MFGKHRGVAHWRRLFVRCGPPLFHFQIQSFVLYYPPPPTPSLPLHPLPTLHGAESQTPLPSSSSRRLARSSWGALLSLASGHAGGRALALFFCLHAAGENPNNNCYCCQRSGIRGGPDAHRSDAQTHNYKSAAVARDRAQQAESLFSIPRCILGIRSKGTSTQWVLLPAELSKRLRVYSKINGVKETSLREPSSSWQG